MTMDVRRTRAWRRLVAWAQLTKPWVCHLCGDDIPRWATRFSPLSYALDHVHPVSVRPDLALSYDNVEPAHKQCNDYRKARSLTPGLKLEIRAKFAHKEPKALTFFDKTQTNVTDSNNPGEGPPKLGDPV